jgi:hypothetical protein
MVPENGNDSAGALVNDQGHILDAIQSASKLLAKIRIKVLLTRHANSNAAASDWNLKIRQVYQCSDGTFSNATLLCARFRVIGHPAISLRPFVGRRSRSLGGPDPRRWRAAASSLGCRRSTIHHQHLR